MAGPLQVSCLVGSDEPFSRSVCVVSASSATKWARNGRCWQLDRWFVSGSIVTLITRYPQVEWIINNVISHNSVWRTLIKLQIFVYFVFCSQVINHKPVRFLNNIFVSQLIDSLSILLSSAHRQIIDQHLILPHFSRLTNSPHRSRSFKPVPVCHPPFSRFSISSTLSLGSLRPVFVGGKTNRAHPLPSSLGKQNIAAVFRAQTHSELVVRCGSWRLAHLHTLA